MRLNLKAAPALAVLALVMLASGAAGARTTADQVVDDATLKAFVEGAAAEIAAITDVAVGGRLRDRFRTDPDWHAGSMFLILFTQSGNPFIHGNDRAAENRDLLDVEDDNGFRVVEALLAAGARGGDFVRYHDGEPKTAYAVEYTSGISGRRFVLVGGYSQDVSHAPLRIADLPRPAVTASQVVDRETLVAFVEAAAKVYSDRALNTEGYRDFAAVRNAFRVEGRDWKSGSVYLWIVAAGNIIFFHATEPFREGQATDLTRTDINGVMFAEELIGGARREGRKFLQYYYDDPSIEGDEDTGSPKLGYAVRVPVFDTGQFAVIGSGVYLASPQVIAARQGTVVESVLPQVMRAMTASTVDAISGRIQRATSNTRAEKEISLGGSSTLSHALLTKGQALGNGTLDLRRLLAGSSFTMPLNLAGSGGSGPTGEITLWGSGDYRNLSGGGSQSMSYDGDVVSAIIGADTWMSPGMMAGAALSQSQGTVDYTEPDGQSGELTTTLTSVNPYAVWGAPGGMNLWLAAGYGWGEVEVGESGGTQTSDMTQKMGAVGASGPLVASDEVIEGGTTNLRLKGEMAFTWTDVDGSGTLESTKLAASRQRLMLEGVHDRELASGAMFSPSLEVGMRNDGGDGETGTGLEAGGGLRYTDPALGLTLEGRARTLLSHGGDYEESGVSGLVRIDAGTEGLGLALSVRPAWGRTASGVQRLWEAETTGGTELAGEAAGRLNARVAYGIGAAWGGRGVLTPYTDVSLSGEGSRRLSLGGRLDIGPSTGMSLEGAHSRSVRGTADHGVMLRGSLHW